MDWFSIPTLTLLVIFQVWIGWRLWNIGNKFDESGEIE